MVALQGLYELDMQRDVPMEDIPAMVTPLLEEAGMEGASADYARQLMIGAWADHDRYDRMIGEASDHWDVSRMAVVDRNILRLGLYELIERPDVPARVVIDEAIELGRTFGTAESPQFINGVLDATWKRDPACQTAREAREAMARPAGSGPDRG
jgi:N utilization substance protein B